MLKFIKYFLIWVWCCAWFIWATPAFDWCWILSLGAAIFWGWQWLPTCLLP